MWTRFWGTCGSPGRSGPDTRRFGANTSCVEVRCDDGTLLVLDCGSGAAGLARSLLSPQDARSGAAVVGAQRGHLLLSHSHWDHVQGVPSFAPLFVPGSEWDIYGPAATGSRLEAVLGGQIEDKYFPVPIEQMGVTLRFHDLDEGTYQMGGARVTARYLNHPAVTLGYRIEAGGASIVYALDHEPHSRHQPDAMLGARTAPSGPSQQAKDPVHREDQRHIDFLRDANLVIHDAQYSAAEYVNRRGSGHTAAETAVEFAVAAGAKRLALSSHDPDKDDAGISSTELACRAHAAELTHARAPLHVFAAAEGAVVELPEVVEPADMTGAAQPASLPVPADLSGGAPTGGTSTQETVLIVDDEPQVVRLLMQALRSAEFRLISANDGDTALRLARSERPDVIFLDWRMPGRDGLDVCRAIRADDDPHLRTVPVVLLTALTSPEDTAAAFAAGATDYLTKPFEVAHVRARVREWLRRAHDL